MHAAFRTLCALSLLASACAHSYIEGTQIRDTDANREILGMIGKIRQSLQERDTATLLDMVSSTYFEDNGTPDPRDDYGYLELKERLAHDSLDTAKELFVDYQVFDIAVQGDRAWADVRYTTRTRLELPAGRVWDTHRDFDRIEFAREVGKWRIIGGL